MIHVVCSTDNEKGLDYAKNVLLTRFAKENANHVRDLLFHCLKDEASISPIKTYVVDRPESGLHAKHHGEIIDGLLRQSLSGDCIILFTHSEVAVIRLLRRIEERSLKASDVSFHVYDPNTDGFLDVRVTDNGDFMDRWPEGFFDERANELFPEKKLPRLEESTVKADAGDLPIYVGSSKNPMMMVRTNVDGHDI